MSDNVDLMVVGMTEQMTADELSNRLVKEFNQPADAFDALVSAATGVGPAYAAQSGVPIAIAIEGKDKLEALGLVCSIPGVTPDASPEPPAVADEVSANSVIADDATTEEVLNDELTISAEADSSDDAELTQLDDLEFGESDNQSAAVTSSENSSSENSSSESVNSESKSSDDDLLASFDELSFDDQPAELPAVTEEVATEADDAVFDLDFGDELSTLGTETPAQPADVENAAPASDEEDLDFGDSFESLSAGFDESVEVVSNSIESSEIESPDVESPADGIDGIDGTEAPESIADIADEYSDLDSLLSDDSEPSAEASVDAPGRTANLDISDIALSDDNSAPLTKPRESSNAELDDGGLSLASDDDIAPIKASATDVPEALANRSPADADLALSLSLDDSDTGAPVASLSTPADLSQSLPDTEASTALEPEILEPVNTEQEATEDLFEEPEPTDSIDTAANLSESEDEFESPHSTGDGARIDTAQDAEPEAMFDSVAETPAETSVAAQVAEDLPAEPAAVDTPTDTPVDLPVESAAPSGAPKSIAEELIESLQGSETVPDTAVVPPTTDSTTSIEHAGTDMSSFAVNDDQEQLRKSREQVAVLQEKIEEDLVEEEQVYQEFEQIAKQRTLHKALGGVAAVASVAAIGAGVYFSGVLTPSVEATVSPVVAVVEPQRDHEQESLNAAIERSATLINPETLSTEELLMSLAQGSGQDTLGDLRRYILGGSSRVAASSEDADSTPRIGAAIPADSNSMKLLKNRVQHSGDKYFDKWSRREIDLRLYIELVDRLIDAGDIVAATELCSRTKDNLFAVMGKQSVARAYKARGDMQEALDMLESASRSTYSIASAPERVVAMADYAYSEHKIGLTEDALDSYLSVSILAASLNRAEYKTIGHTAVSDYLKRAGLDREANKQLNRAIDAAMELPGNSAARDLALRHIALTEARMGLFDNAIKHTDQIIDPFASVSAYHGIALEYEARKDYAMATEVIQKAFDASTVIADKEKRRQLLSKIRLANSD